MPNKPVTEQQLLAENEDLRVRLEQAKASLREMRSGEVDALVVSDAGGVQLFAPADADQSFRILVGEMSEGALTMTAQGVIVYANRHFAGMLKTPLEKVIGSTLRTWIAPASQPVLQSLLDKGAGEERREELMLAASDGMRVPVYLSASNLPLEGSRDAYCLVVFDLTEHNRTEAIAASESVARELLAAANQSRGELLRVIEDKTRAEEAQRESEAKYRDVVTQISEGIFITDDRGTLTFCNQALARIHGFEHPEQLVGKRIMEFIAPASLDEVADNFRQAVEGKPAMAQLTIHILRRDGTQGVVEVSATAKRESGKFAGTFGIERDITERKQAENALRDAHDIFDRSSAVAFLWKNEANWPVEYVSNNVTTLFGYSSEEFTSGRLVYASLIYPEDLGRVGEEVAHASGEKDVTNFAHLPYRIITKSGLLKWVSDDTVIRRDASGSITHYQGVMMDITESIEAKEQLRLAASVFSHTREGITITDGKGTILEVNEAFTDITGYSREDIIGQNSRILSFGRQNEAFYQAMWEALKNQGHWSGEIWNRRKDGTVMAELLTISAIRDGQGITQQYVGLFSDITQRKAYESQLEHLAHFDSLTRLPNRALLADRLHQAMAQAQRRGKKLVVVFLDLDGFKAVNDSHGHEAGDQLLITLARRLKDALREGDTLARIGGDEFVAVLTDLEDTTASVPLLKRLLAAAALPVQIGDLALQVSASLGVSFFPQEQDLDADQLLRQADQAMYQAKVAGKNRYCVFEAAQPVNDPAAS